MIEYQLFDYFRTLIFLNQLFYVPVRSILIFVLLHLLHATVLSVGHLKDLVRRYCRFRKYFSFQVIEEKDYPPTANAGEDVVVYLPNNQVILHGNQSSDDHGIVSWEWTLNEGKQIHKSEYGCGIPDP